jgi:tetratricopeptide (TPR) repeat protein
MSLLIKALKKAEQKHLMATAIALEQVSLDPTVIAAANAAPQSASGPQPTQPAIELPPIVQETHVLSIEEPPSALPSTLEKTSIKAALAPEIPKPIKAITKEIHEPATLKRWLSLGIFVSIAMVTAVCYLLWESQSGSQRVPINATSQLALDLAQTANVKPPSFTAQNTSTESSTTQEIKKTSVVFGAETKYLEKKRPVESSDRIHAQVSKAEAQGVEHKPDATVSINPTSLPLPGPKLIRQDSNDRISKLSDLAFAAQGKQDHSQAMLLYEQILELDKNNLDALLGKASLVAKNGDTASATRLYGRVLELEPNDSAARTALASLRTIVDPEGQESNLRNLLAKDPTQPSLLFALGNSLAAQGRWSEAQTVYFQAYNGDSQQPDYAFNLAISLERIRQNALALTYYRSALELTHTKSARFKTDQVRQRIAALEKPMRTEANDGMKE